MLQAPGQFRTNSKRNLNSELEDARGNGFGALEDQPAEADQEENAVRQAIEKATLQQKVQQLEAEYSTNPEAELTALRNEILELCGRVETATEDLDKIHAMGFGPGKTMQQCYAEAKVQGIFNQQ